MLPLKPLLEHDADITQVIVISPAAQYRHQLFANFGSKFTFTTEAKVEADCVVTTTAGLDPNDVPILQAARRAHIPTLTFVGSWDNVYKMERVASLRKYQQQYVLADKFIVWNSMNRDHLLRIFPQLKPRQIAVVGAPRLDYFTHDNKIPSREQLFQHLGFPRDAGKLIHFATTELYPMEYIIKTITRAKRKKKIPHSLHLYASVHPGGQLAKHQQYADKYGVTVRYSFGRRDSSPHPDFLYNPTETDIYMLIALFKHADLLINQSSTVAIESFAGDTPVINVKYGQSLDWWRWYRSMVYRDFNQHYRDIISGGATKVVTNSTALVAAVNHYLDHPEQDRNQRQQTLTKMITTTDGTASQQLIDIIKHRH